eukprot:gene25619-11273_t
MAELWRWDEWFYSNLGVISVVALVLFFLFQKIARKGTLGRGVQLAAPSFASGVSRKKEEFSSETVMNNDVRRAMAVEQLQLKYEQEAKEKAAAKQEKEELQKKVVPETQTMPPKPPSSSSAHKGLSMDNFGAASAATSSVKPWRSDRVKRGG